MDEQILPPPPLVARLASFEHELARSVADAVAQRWLVGALRCASHFGDGALSATACALLLAADEPSAAAVFVAATALGILVQNRLKGRYRRCRPCHRADGPPQRVRIPDPGSFPSGHTLHAVLAAVVLACMVPAAGAVSVALAVVIGLSRVVLGVHYPSDVLAGASLGALLGLGVVLLA